MTFNVTIHVDMVKIENRGAYKSVLWAPFNKDADLQRIDTTAKNVKELEIQVARIADESKALALERIAKTGDQFNGIRVSCMLAKGQRKPNGWNTSKRLRIEREIKTDGDLQQT